jgi:tetratricopeptide (TPR) repeat protein
MLRLHHPNVVEVRDFGWLESGDPYLVMEYVEGPSLSTYMRVYNAQLADFDAAHLNRCTNIWLQLCESLAFIHENNMVHRDVKPSNVLLKNVSGDSSPGASAMQLKLMDFGLARFADDSMNLTQAGSMVGTASYISPEQASGLKVDYRTDLYSMGVIMYEMVTGRTPFGAETPLATIRMHIDAPPVPPVFLNPAIPDYINAIILNLLSKQPEERFASAREVAQALRTQSMPEVISRSARGGDLPALLGRDEITAQLQESCAIAWTQRRAGACIITGDDGLGKTALLGELWNWAKRRGATVLRGVCAETSRIPYGAIAEALTTFLVSSRQNARRESLLKDIYEDISRIIPELGPAPAELPRVDPLQSQARLYSAVALLLSRIAANKPILWIIDDAHWLGADALDLLSFILRRNDETRICVLIAAKPDGLLRLSPIEQSLGHDRVRTTTLTPLDDHSTRRMAEGALGSRLSPNAVQFIVDRADGNPLFIRELAHTLKAERPTREALDSVTQTMSLPVPVRIARVVANRLSELTAAQRGFLEWASIYGREFELDMLANAAEQSADDLADIADHLIAKQLLQEQRGVRRDTFRFTHRQLQDLVYDGLGSRRKKSMHGSVGRVLEQAETASPADLEYHFDRAGNNVLAIRYGISAGDRARDAYAHQDALAFYRRVLARLGDIRPTDPLAEAAAHANYGLGETLFFMGQYAQARANFERAAALTEQ